MKMTTEMIEDIWKTIEIDAQNHKGKAIVERQIPNCFSRKFYVGLKLPENERFFYFTISSAYAPSSSDLPDATGFRVDLGMFPGAKEPSIVVVLLDRAFSDVFDVFLEDLVQRLDKTKSDAECVSTLTNRIGAWKHFLKSFRPTGLTPEEQRGLFGELHFLACHLLPLYGPHSIGAWVGPDDAHQDFHYNACAIEAKASVQKKPRNIIISSEKQLDPESFRALILSHVSVDESEIVGETLNELVSRVRKMLGDEVLEEMRFLEKLNSMGYVESQAKMYTTKYSVRSSEFYLVHGDFPRIVGSDLRVGIGGIRYTVSLDACEKYVMSIEKVTEILNGT